MSRLRKHLLATACALPFAITAGSASALTVTTTNNPTTLANTILGPGVSLLGPASYVGAPGAAGTFTNGGNIGFGSGILLTTGSAASAAGPNDSDNSGPETLGSGVNNEETADEIANGASTNNGGPGHAGLDTLVGGNTRDATSLRFTFQFDGGGGGNLFFNYVFASEEYIDYVNSDFNDVFALFLDGVNIALLPDASVVSINNVNPASHGAFYRNNVRNTNGLPNLGIDMEYDGATVVLTATALGLAAGKHTMEFVIADREDGILDSAVFIQMGTFSTEQTPVPAPATLALLGFGLAGFGWLRRRKA